MAAIMINKDNFRQEVLESNKPVLLDFWAGWCGPCRMLGPVIDEIARENPHIKVGKVNVDEEPALTEQFKVISIPSLFVLKGGQVVNKAVGVLPKHQILALLD